VLFIGHFDAQKRPEWFVEVIGSLRSRGIGFTAAMVGGGREDAALADNARAVGIELLGARDDVPSLLATADVLVFTSRPPEGMPGVLIEAGLAGLPVVTTDVPGANEIVEDGVTGLIVSVDDKPELVDAVESLLADRSRRHTMGTAARERCARLFSLESSAAEWETLLAEIPS
jgi:glycosyltransferase involved in cell wall biosynthesis